MAEFPTSVRVPRSWLLQHACPAIRYRTLTEIFPGSDPRLAESVRVGAGERRIRPSGREEAEGLRGVGREPPRRLPQQGRRDQGRRHVSPVSSPGRAGLEPGKPGAEAREPPPVPAPVTGCRPQAALRVRQVRWAEPGTEPSDPEGDPRGRRGRARALRIRRRSARPWRRARVGEPDLGVSPGATSPRNRWSRAGARGS